MNSTYTAPRRLIKTPDEIEKMRIAGKLAAEVLDMIKPHIVPGVTTLELDTICHDYIVNIQQAIPACLGYGAAPGRPAFNMSFAPRSTMWFVTAFLLKTKC
jgi:methionyl aminopeptidase